MKAPKTAEKIESPSDSFGLRTIRNNVVAIMLGAMSVSGCKVCTSFRWSTEDNPATILAAKKEEAKEEARASAVSMDESRDISVDRINTTIALNRFEIRGDCRTKIDALMNISEYSPLLEASDSAREYALSKEDLPWTKLVVQPLPKKKGGISLRTEGDKIAMVFRCKNLEEGKDAVCMGEEMDPEKLDKAIVRIGKKFKKQQKKKKAEEERREKKKNHQNEGHNEGGEAKPDDSKIPARIFDAEGRTSIKPIKEVGEQLAQMSEAIKLIGYDAQKVLARRIVTDLHKAELEELIKKMDSGPDLEKLNMNSIIAFLLAANPKMIPQVAQELGISLSKKSD